MPWREPREEAHCLHLPTDPREKLRAHRRCLHPGSSNSAHLSIQQLIPTMLCRMCQSRQKCDVADQDKPVLCSHGTHILVGRTFTSNQLRKRQQNVKSKLKMNNPFRIPNLPLGEQGPLLITKGRSVLPFCHFDLKESDYISGHRRNPELRGPGSGPLEPNTRVIEFTSVGIGGKNLR